MTRAETLAVMSILKAAYPAYYRDMKRQDAEAVVNLWAEMLADYPADLVAAAVKSHIASDRKGFPPHIGAIIAPTARASLRTSGRLSPASGRSADRRNSPRGKHGR